MKESTKKLLALIALKGGDIGILARAILELELQTEKQPKWKQEKFKTLKLALDYVEKAMDESERMKL